MTNLFFYDSFEELDALIAVSGGIDSMSLLHTILNSKVANKNQYIVCHLNHKLRGNESEKDELLVKQFCKDHNLDLIVGRINIKKILQNKNKSYSLEAIARTARHQFFLIVSELTKINNVILGHNENDQIETILMNIVRGCGKNGLLGMREKNKYTIKRHKDYKIKLDYYHFQKININNNNNNIIDTNFVLEELSINFIRPMLNVSRNDIYAYAKKNNLVWRDDETNSQNFFLRNKIRNTLIPILNKTFNKNIGESILKLQKIITQEEDFLNDYSKDILMKIELNDNENNNYIKKIKSESKTYKRKYSKIDLGNFDKLHQAIKSRVIFLWLNKNNISQISSDLINKIIQISSKSNKISRLNLPDNLLVSRKSGLLHICHQKDYSS